MGRNIQQVSSDVQNLTRIGFTVEYANDFSWVHVIGLDLPKRRGIWTTVNNQYLDTVSVLLDIPPDWPLYPPGIGFVHPSFSIHIPFLAFNGVPIRDLHTCNHAPWYWLCFREIQWRPDYGLLGLLKIIEKSIWERTR